MPELPLLLVIEDGDDYTTFAKLFLSDRFQPVCAKSLRDALPHAKQAVAILLDLRFDLSPQEDLIGDIVEVSNKLFGGDANRALSYLKENQGILILAELRKQNCHAPALIINDLPARRLANLRSLYGKVAAVPDFDANSMKVAFSELLS
jgi:hypothetical protein